MTTLATAKAALKTLIDADPPTEGSAPLPMFWEADSIELPDTPAPFVYFEIVMDHAFVAGYGGGRFNNLYRNTGELHAYIFVPTETGIDLGIGYGEQVASTFRSYRSSDISCFGASVEPLGKGAELVPNGLSKGVAGSYYATLAVVDFYFDQIG